MNDNSSFASQDTLRLPLKKRAQSKWNEVLKELRGVLENMKKSEIVVDERGDACFCTNECRRLWDPLSPGSAKTLPARIERNCTVNWNATATGCPLLSPCRSTGKGGSPFYCFGSNEPNAPSKRRSGVQKRMEINSQTGLVEAMSPIIPTSCQAHWIDIPGPDFEDSNGARHVSLVGDCLGRSRMRDEALKRLLQILNIDVLEGILRAKDRIDGLCSPQRNFLSSIRKIGREKLPCSSHYTKEKGIGSFDLRHTNSPYQFNDIWMDMAIGCLGRLKTKILLGISNQPDLPHARKYIYDQVKRLYEQLTFEERLIPSEYVPIIVAITKLLFNENRRHNDQAIEASQLLLVLLRDDRRERLMELFRFMHYVASKEDELLSQSTTNENVVVKDLLNIVVKAKSEAQREVKFWLRFVIKNFDSICRAFLLFENDVLEQAIGSSEAEFCRMLKANEYEQQTTEASERELVRMVVTVMRNDNLTHNEKIRWLAKFKQEYPQLYYSRFPFLEERFSATRMFSV